MDNAWNVRMGSEKNDPKLKLGSYITLHFWIYVTDML